MRPMRSAVEPARWSRAAAVVALVVAAVVLGADPAVADRLVVFKNGKSFRVKNVKVEKGWTRLELDASNYMAVRSDQILAVEDVAGTAPAKADLPNQVPLGGGGGYSPPPAYSPRAEEPPEAPQEQGDDFQQAPQEGLQPPPPPPPQTAVPGISGARPFNQQLPQQMNRGLRRNRSVESAPSNLRQPMNNVPGVNRPIRGGSGDDDD